MSLIQSQQDDIEVLRAEDEAIIAADNPPEHQVTALDHLAEILNGETNVHDEAAS